MSETIIELLFNLFLFLLQLQYDFTDLIKSVETYHFNIVQLLIEHNVDVNIANKVSELNDIILIMVHRGTMELIFVLVISLLEQLH